jgi:hypothetical protein
VNGAIEYLVRYIRPGLDHDVWVKALHLVCSKKIMEYLSEGAPPGVEPRPPPAGFPVAAIPPASPEVEIVGLERNTDGRVLVAFRVGGELQYLPHEEMLKRFDRQMLEFFEAPPDRGQY